MASNRECDFLVIGAGVAGLRAALELAEHGDVLVITKESVRESNTHYAQGGIAVAEPEREQISLHLEDTINAGDGLVHRAAAEVLVNEGPERVAELIEWGARFDEENGHLLRTREAAHSLPRILHANGDATGAEISRSLAAMARTHGQVRFAEWTSVTGVVAPGGRVTGVDLLDSENNATRIGARSVLIAAGGAGQVFADTTNPAVATGDGIALAATIGAELADMEFYQFHPTAFSLSGAPRFLLSEALRGEGAYLRNDRGERFMERYHPKLELAPRDVVARAVAREGMGEVPGALRPVYLDMRQVHRLDLHDRFPGISAFLAKYGLDLQRDLIPVRPAAHYMMGGVRTDLEGRTSVRGLYAAGEAACTGVHGANRLASNSLLEGLVFGARAAKAMLADGLGPESSGQIAASPQGPVANDATIEERITDLQNLMSHYAGLVRDGSLLREGLAERARLWSALEHIESTSRPTRRLAEARALYGIAEAILRSALARTESRGAHFRSDFPQRDDTDFRKHSILASENEVRFESW